MPSSAHIIPGIQGVVFGVAIVVVILLAPEGMFWRLRDCVHRRGRTWSADGAGRRSRRDAAPCSGRELPSRCRGDGRRRDPVGARTVEELRRPEGGAERRLRRAARRDPRHHRPERRRQDHGFQPAQRLPARRTRGSVLLDGPATSIGRKPLPALRAPASAAPSRSCGRSLRMSVADNVVVGAYVRADTDAEATPARGATRSPASGCPRCAPPRRRAHHQASCA